MNKDYSSIQQLDHDISCVCKSLTNTSLSTIPSMRPHHRNHTSIRFLSHLGVVMLPIGSGKQQVAQGPARLYEIGKRVNVNKVASNLTKCKACIERINIQKCNESFASESPRRFRSHPSKSEGSSLLLDGTLVSDPDIVLKKWVDHFSKLSESSTLQILLVPNESHNLPRQ